MSTLQQLEMQRRALEAQFNTFTKPLEIRMEATLATLTRTHPRMTVDQVHALALEDPHYAADAKVYARYAADYKLKADNVAKRIDELKHGARVGAGLGPELSGDKKSDGAAKKPSSNAKHPVRVPVYNERSLLARVGFNPKNPKQFDAIEAFLNEAKLAHANSVARRKLIAELEQHKDLTAEQRESYEHALAQPDPYKIFLNKVGAMEKKHLRDDAKSKAQARADARSAPRGIRIRGELGSDSSTGSPSTWVGATSVGVVVAMCACVAAFAVVRRRQRQSESAAPVVDGYATLV